MSGDQKTCTKCGETKFLNQFSPSKTGRLGVVAQCKPCKAAQQRERPAEAKRAAEKRWRETHAEANREGNRVRGRRWYQNNLEHAREVCRDAARNRRMTIRAAGFFDTFDWSEVRAAADECYLCGEDLPFLPMGAEIHPDHVVPVSRGGAHSLANLMPVHADCNWKKSKKYLSELDWYDGPLTIGAWSVRPVTCERR